MRGISDELSCSRNAIEEVEFRLAQQLQQERDHFEDQLNAMRAQMEAMYAQHTDFAKDLYEFQVQSEMCKMKMKALVTKHRQHLYSRIEETLSHRWNKWSANRLNYKYS